jgi:hypothetical protein
MAQGATDGSSQHGLEGTKEKREREKPHSGGVERTKGNHGWKTRGERPRHIGRRRPERRSESGELDASGHEWRGYCQL